MIICIYLILLIHILCNVLEPEVEHGLSGQPIMFFIFALEGSNKVRVFLTFMNQGCVVEL